MVYLLVDILYEDTWRLWSFIVDRAFSIEFKRIDESEHRKLVREINEREIGLYIHFPFCRSFCRYCPYYRGLWNEKVFEKYSKALVEEIRLIGKLLSEHDPVVVDAHVGGGTPSLAPPSFWRSILEELKSVFNWKASLGIEANPDDLADESKAFALRDAGVSEVSIGVQSFHRSLLRELGRRHGPEESIVAIENARKAGYSLVNIDLMYMIPGQDLGMWEEDLRIAGELEPTQITVYPTLITRQAIIWNDAIRGKVKQPVKLFEKFASLPQEVLKDYGYHMIRIDSWSKLGDYSTVNLEMTGPLIALGAGAFGFTGTYEWINVHSINEYIRSLLNGKLPVVAGRNVTVSEKTARIVADQLFYRGVLDTKFLREKYGLSLENLPKPFKWALRIMKILGFIEGSGERLRLTQKGIMAAHKFVWTFVLKVPCKLAYKLMETPWPARITVP
ncbi:MAG: hypothetical protein DRO13_05875 [Thermoprotei archaeon]|nr:MAG: hypothetical protein DRO13_05875 [Thermoprotei archaeon]